MFPMLRVLLQQDLPILRGVVTGKWRDLNTRYRKSAKADDTLSILTSASAVLSQESGASGGPTKSSVTKARPAETVTSATVTGKASLASVVVVPETTTRKRPYDTLTQPRGDTTGGEPVQKVARVAKERGALSPQAQGSRDTVTFTQDTEQSVQNARQHENERGTLTSQPARLRRERVFHLSNRREPEPSRHNDSHDSESEDWRVLSSSDGQSDEQSDGQSMDMEDTRSVRSWVTESNLTMTVRNVSLEACRNEILRALPPEALPNLSQCKAKKVLASVDQATQDDMPTRLFPQSVKVKEVLEEVTTFLETGTCSPGMLCPSSALSASLVFEPKSYDTTMPFFETSPPLAERELKSLGIKRPPKNALIGVNKIVELEKLARQQVALASFQEQASHAMSQILNKESLNRSDVDSLKSIVTGMNRSALVATGTAVLTSTNLLLCRRDAYTEKLKVGDETTKIQLRTAPLEGKWLFGGATMIRQIKEEISKELPLKLLTNQATRQSRPFYTQQRSYNVRKPSFRDTRQSFRQRRREYTYKSRQPQTSQATKGRGRGKSHAATSGASRRM